VAEAVAGGRFRRLAVPGFPAVAPGGRGSTGPRVVLPGRRAVRAGQPVQEVVGAAAGVGADQHPAPGLAGHLGESELGHRDVLGRGVRSGVASAQQDRQRFPARPTAVVDERGERMEPVGILPRGSGLLLL